MIIEVSNFQQLIGNLNDFENLLLPEEVVVALDLIVADSEGYCTVVSVVNSNNVITDSTYAINMNDA